jgi:acetyltransferase-like isoleucine patch superfamily enzyme
LSPIKKIKEWLGSSQTLLTNKLPQYSKYAIGDWTYGRPNVLDWHDGTQLKIGKFCSIARDVKIVVGGEHHLDWVTTYPFSKFWANPAPNGSPDVVRSKGDVIIMNDVWIGTGALILSGVTIHDGAVIGAGSVVTKDVPAYGIVAGNPARLLRHRFEPNLIAQLQNIAWWNWPSEKIRRAWPLLMASNIRGFVEWCENQTK